MMRKQAMAVAESMMEEILLQPFAINGGATKSVKPWNAAYSPGEYDNQRTIDSTRNAVLCKSKHTEAYVLQGASPKPKTIEPSWLVYEFDLAPRLRGASLQPRLNTALANQGRHLAVGDDAVALAFTVGDRVKIRLVNEMDSDHPMHHPFHLHGAGRFLVLSRDGVPEPNLVWKDTVLVRTGHDARVHHPAQRVHQRVVAQHPEAALQLGLLVPLRVAPVDLAVADGRPFLAARVTTASRRTPSATPASVWAPAASQRTPCWIYWRVNAPNAPRWPWSGVRPYRFHRNQCGPQASTSPVTNWPAPTARTRRVPMIATTAPTTTARGRPRRQERT